MASEENKITMEETAKHTEEVNQEVSEGQTVQEAEPQEPVMETPVVERSEPMAEKSVAEELPVVHREVHQEPQHAFSREEWILTHLEGKELLEYLKLEHQKEEDELSAKETRQKRILSAFQLAMSLAAAVSIVYVLSANPTILVNILYIAGLIAGMWIWKNPREK